MIFGIIYKISCKDLTVHDTYIGSTCNFDRRKRQHKYNVNDGKETNRALYQHIRKYGNWENWTIEILDKIKTKSIKHLRRIELLYIRGNKPNLNFRFNSDYFLK
jgi:predicted GIY-YIG superfamily endonuclease